MSVLEYMIINDKGTIHKYMINTQVDLHVQEKTCQDILKYFPDDVEIDVDEVGGMSIRDLDSDVSKLKEYATGQKPTMKELVQNIKRQKRASDITDDIDGAASDAVVRRQGDYDPSDYDDFASGGIARLLGE